MNKSLFRYIWRYSRREQLVIFAVVIASLPFYFVSLDLPKSIVNEAIQGRAYEKGRTTAPFLNLSVQWPDWIGGGKTVLFEGFNVERLTLLLGLSFLFLFFVLVNGWFKYYINVAKGALGERMMRRMRFELFSYVLRFTPETMRTVKSSEAATIIKDEVEPIGGFIGDAFILPMFLGTQAATALIFILMQSIWLGGLAAGVVGIQFVVIPRMRRELLRLGRKRQLSSRRLAGRIGEVIDGVEAIHVHDTAAWERAEIGNRLYVLFDIRFKIYKRKFVVKFLNNLLAQMTPFFFYAVGGYFALRGRLDIGQLVAVIAAYRELPPPLKELIDWDQQRLDVQVKYDQVVQYFASDKLLPADHEEAETEDVSLGGRLAADGLTVLDNHGTTVLEGVDLAVDLPTHLGIVSDGTAAASLLARTFARLESAHGGTVKFGDRDLATLSRGTVARRIGYAGVEPILFPVSLRDNITYGLRHHPLSEPEQDLAEMQRRDEAKWTGNPVESVGVDWVDLSIAGADSAEAFDTMLVGALTEMGFVDELYRFGLNGTIDPERQPELAERIVDARHRFRERLEADGMSDLIEPFDPERFNSQATIAENLLFGVPTSRNLQGRALSEFEPFREALDRARLTDELVAIGAKIAAEMTEIFRDLPPGHPLFEQFAFMSADELGEFAAIVNRSGMRGRAGLTRDDRTRLLALPLAYIEPRHRLGLLDEALAGRLTAARAAVRAMLEALPEPTVDFYERDELCMAAPVRDNLLFGRVNNGIADARERIRVAGAEVIKDAGLRDAIERVGLDHQVGPSGRLLTAAQRASVSLIRCIVKRPDVLVLDGALAPFGDTHSAAILEAVMRRMEDRTLITVLPNDGQAHLFDHVIRIDGTHARLEAAPAGAGGAERAADPERPDDGEPDGAEREDIAPEPEPEPEQEPDPEAEPTASAPTGAEKPGASHEDAERHPQAAE